MTVAPDPAPVPGPVSSSGATPITIRGRSPWAAAWDSLRLMMRDSFALIGVVVLSVFVVLAVLAPWLAPYDPFQAMMTEAGRLNRLSPPTAANPFGTTGFGQDVLSQFLYGFRVALMVGLVAAVAVGFISTLFGVLSGYFGGLVDDVLMRITDVALSIPTLPFAIVAVALLGPSIENIILVITILFWRNGARIIRSAVLTEKERVYVKWARAAGASHFHIIMRHILPNVFRVVFLWITMSVAFAILTEASLSFLGLGDPKAISWGQMLNTAFSSGNLRTAWWWVVPPSVALVLLVSSLYLIGRAYEEQTNPRLRRR
ncbi:ABC transporter permease [Acuticoccus yangtzensis]|uniref:ABC transporter permease n=1 Tax=Acuticoccus yangtzensis TaxID=1443441 RepID=UPI0009F7AB25|nr:ABC transporter permease [Acuticoccus yangtzensis]ORE94206.1 binding-protein-dependent transport systems inner membrane component [Stappia sp. 22II-S9-Z10]